jgi:signal recognition particle GTPase
MFEVLTEKSSKVLRGLSSQSRLGEKDIDDAPRQVRLALLEAESSSFK